MKGRLMLSKMANKMTNKQKRECIVFLLAGLIGLILHKVEDALNDKAIEYFPDKVK